MDYSNKKINILICDGKCIITKCDTNSASKIKKDIIKSPNSIEDISMTISQSIDSKINYNAPKNSNIKKDDLEISLKSIFFSDKKNENKNTLNIKPEFVKNIDFLKEMKLSNDKTTAFSKEQKTNQIKVLFNDISINPFNNELNQLTERNEILNNSNNNSLLNLKIKKIKIQSNEEKIYNNNNKNQLFLPNPGNKNTKKQDLIHKFFQNVQHKKYTNYNIKQNNNKTKRNHSFTSLNNYNLMKTKKQINHHSSASCLLLSKSIKKKNLSEKNSKNNSPSIINTSGKKSSSFIMNTPIIIKQNKNSILKNTLVHNKNNNNKSYNNIDTPKINYNTDKSKKIYFKSPSVQLQNKFQIPNLNKNIKTSPSPPKITNNLISVCNISGLKKKKVCTINNFSNYIKKSKNTNIKNKNNINNYEEQNKSVRNKKLNGMKLFQNYK